MSCSSCSGQIVDEPVVIGGTYYWLLTAYKDDVIWDLTGATITHYFQKPDRTIKSYSAIILVATDGTAYQINPSSTFDSVGVWKHSWKILQSGIEIESAFEEFPVHKSLASLA